MLESTTCTPFITPVKHKNMSESMAEKTEADPQHEKPESMAEKTEADPQYEKPESMAEKTEADPQHDQSEVYPHYSVLM